MALPSQQLLMPAKKKPTPQKASPPKPAAAQRGSKKREEKPPRDTAAPRSSKKPAARSPSAPSKPGLFDRWQGLSPERKLDFVGAILALVGLLTLLSLLSPNNAGLLKAWVDALKYVTGWGVFVLPLGLLIGGMWLVLRRVERLPRLSAERLTGLVVSYLDLLGWLHLLGGRGLELAKAQHGGGYLGWMIEAALTGLVGVGGAVVVLLAGLLAGVIFTFDLSLADLGRLWRGIQQGSHRDTADGVQRQPLSVTPPPIEDLPPDFHPLPERPVAVRKPAARLAPAVKPSAMPPAAQRTAVTAPAAEENAPMVPASETVTEEPAIAQNWKLPGVAEILDPPTPAAIQGTVDQERARLIESTLRSFGAPAHVVEIHQGPTVTQFGVEPDFVETRSGKTRVRVSKIVSLADDLALALAAPRIRIQAPVPGRSYVGIEVPNAEISRVVLREVMESDVFQRMKSPLRLALGKDVAGKPVCADLTSMPHLLIAGTTGSGKSVCVNSILCTLLLTHSPADLRLILVDPKRVELTGYNGLPHLLAPVVVDTERVMGALQWVQREMDARYHKFSEQGCRNIVEFNRRYPQQALPYLVVVVDELADLMMQSPEETERSITRLAQLARATGIHLVLATQRPSVDVVTGLIKANFPSRIAFAVASGIDSRVILDQPGAERLLGRGDMLFQAPDAPAPVRSQGVYVSDAEIQRLVDTWRVAAINATAQPTPLSNERVDDLPGGVPLRQASFWEEGDDPKADPLLDEAVDLVRREGRASTTMLQRRMRIGYTRAARLMDALEDKGVIGPPQPHSQVREVLDYGDAAPPPED